MVIMPVPMIKWEEVTELDKTSRGEKGYGSKTRVDYFVKIKI